jgi:hypothetical protein
MARLIARDKWSQLIADEEVGDTNSDRARSLKRVYENQGYRVSFIL